MTDLINILKAFTENKIDIVFMLDDKGKILFSSGLEEEILNYTSQETTGKNFFELFSPENSRQETLSIYNKILLKTSSTKKVRKIKLLRKDSKSINCEIHFNPSKYKNQTVCLLFIRAPIKEKNKFEIYKDIAETYQIIANTARDAIIMINNEGKINYWNHAAEIMFGYTKEEALNKNVHKLIAPSKYIEAYQRGFEAFTKTGKGLAIDKNLEFKAIRKDGKEIFIELSISPLKIETHWNAFAFIRDVTERKLAESALKESEERFRTVFINSPLGLGIVNIDGSFMTLNKSGLELLEYNINEILNASLKTIVHPDYNQEIFEAIDSLVKGNSDCWLSEIIFLSKSGQKIWVKINLSCVKDINGNPLYLINIFEDITEHKNYKKNLETKEYKYTQLLENLTCGVVVLEGINNNREIIIKSINKASENITKIKKEDVIGKNVTEVFSGLKKDDLYKLIIQLLKDGKPIHIPYFYYEGNNVTGWREYRAYKLSETEVVAMYYDITDLKNTEDKLKLTQFSVDSSYIPTYWTTSDGKILHANKASSKALGYTIEELKSMTVFDIQKAYTPHSWAERWKKLKNKGILRNEAFHTRKDGTKYPVEITSNYFEYEGQEYNFAFVQDITERKRIEKELSERQYILEQTVEAKTKELRESLEKLKDVNLSLKEANNHKNKFLSTMSHELRTPLNAILGFTNLLNGQYYGPLEPKQKEYLNIINESATHLHTLINDILDIARIDSNSLELNSQDFSLNDCIQNIVKMLNPQYNNKKISLDVNIMSPVPIVYADLRRSKQVLLNLLNNALKFTNPGGIVKIHVDYFNNDKIKVSVIDNGIGIKKEEIDKVFKEFYQSDTVKDINLTGAGIGLALSKRLVEIQGGEIGLESEFGKGSTFWFTIPLFKTILKSQNSDNSLEQKLPPTDSVKTKMLIVEDNSLNLKLLTDILSIYKQELIIARNGQEAYEKALSEKPDIILMDIKMPVMSGDKVMKKLRALPEFSKLPIIALTASAGEASKIKHVEAGFTDQIDKPYTIAELFKCLDQYIKKT